MKFSLMKLWVAGVFVLGLVGLAVAADMPAAGEMSPEQKAMMERVEQYSAVNENHALFAPLAGSWKTVLEHQMGVDAPVEKSEGTSENTLIFGGRFLDQNYKGSMNGMPYEGKSIMGFDNIQKKFQGIWYDSFGTGIMNSTSTYDQEKHVFNEEGMVSCPLTNGLRKFRAATTLVDADNYTFEMFMNDENGKEFRAMQIQYTRVK